MLIRVSFFYVNVFIQYTWFIFIKKKAVFVICVGNGCTKRTGKANLRLYTYIRQER